MSDLTYDVIVIGGGAAGSSTALVLGRARADVLVLDGGEPSNSPADGIGGLLGHEGRSPGAFSALARAELARLPSVTRRSQLATSLQRFDESWSVSADDGRRTRADHVVLAMGMRYAYPSIEGLEPLWGRTVVHCPFCHGWELRDRPLGVLGGDAMTFERALLVRRWSDDVLVVDEDGSLDASQRGRLDAAGIAVVDGRVVSLTGDGDQLRALVLEDGRVIERGGLLVAAPHTARSSLLDSVGVEHDPSGHVVVDALGRTSLPRLWAVGDLTSPMAQVSRAVAAGATAAAGVVQAMTAARYGLELPPPGLSAAAAHADRG